MTDHHTHSAHCREAALGAQTALKVMTTVTDSAFNLVCLHLQIMIMVYIIFFAGFAHLNHSDLFTNNHMIVCKERHM